MEQQRQVSGRHATAEPLPAVAAVGNVRNGSVGAGLFVMLADGITRAERPPPAARTRAAPSPSTASGSGPSTP